MSGGSYNYLSTMGDTVWGAADEGYSLRRMAERLREVAPDHPVTSYTTALVEALGQATPQEVRAVWHAIEWHDSADWGQDQRDDVLDKTRGWAP